MIAVVELLIQEIKRVIRLLFSEGLGFLSFLKQEQEW